MDALQKLVSTMEEGLEVIKALQDLNAPAEQKEHLASFIVAFVKRTERQSSVEEKENKDINTDLPHEHLSVVKSVTSILPRGKHDLIFLETCLRLRGTKQDTDIPYSKILDVAIIDNMPKDPKKRVLLFLNLQSDTGSKSKAGLAAFVFQVQRDAELDLASPTPGSDRLTGPAVVVLCRALGLRGVQPTAFVAPSKDLFCSSNGHVAVEAVMGVNQGWLFPLQSALCFLEKPPIWIAHKDINFVEFCGTGAGSRTFDFCLHIMEDKTIEFTNLSKSDFGAVSSYVSRSGLTIGTEEGAEQVDGTGQKEIHESDDSDAEDSDFDPEDSSSECESATGNSANDAGEKDEDGSEDEDCEADDSDSDASFVSEEGVPAAALKRLIDEAGKTKKKRRFE